MAESHGRQSERDGWGQSETLGHAHAHAHAQSHSLSLTGAGAGLRRVLIRSMDVAIVASCFFVVDLFFFFFFFFAPAHSNVDNLGRGGDSVHASVMLGWKMGASHALLQCNPVRTEKERDAQRYSTVHV